MTKQDKIFYTKGLLIMLIWIFGIFGSFGSVDRILHSGTSP